MTRSSSRSRPTSLYSGEPPAPSQTRLVRDLEDALRAREAQLVTGVSEAVNEEIRRLTQGGARVRGSVERTAKRWVVGLTALGLAEAVAIWFAQRGG